MCSKDNNFRQGFTLIELLVVIAIIGLLSSVIMSVLAQSRMKSRDIKRIINAKQIALALESYNSDKSTYRVFHSGWQNTGGGFASRVNGSQQYWNSILSSLNSAGYYGGTKIVDPVYGDANYYIGQCGGAGTYNIYLKLEQPQAFDSPMAVSSGCDGDAAQTAGMNFVLAMGNGPLPAAVTPSTPSGISAVVSYLDSFTVGTVTFTGFASNPGVEYFDIYRGGLFLTSIPGSSVQYVDSSHPQCQTIPTYTIIARNGSKTSGAFALPVSLTGCSD